MGTQAAEQVTTHVDHLDDQHTTTRGDFCSFPTGHLHGLPDGSPAADDTTNAGCSKKVPVQTTHRDWQQQWEQEIRIHAVQLQAYGPQKYNRCSEKYTNNRNMYCGKIR
jgi:hypothetical protein